MSTLRDMSNPSTRLSVFPDIVGAIIPHLKTVSMDVTSSSTFGTIKELKVESFDSASPSTEEEEQGFVLVLLLRLSSAQDYMGNKIPGSKIMAEYGGLSVSRKRRSIGCKDKIC